ncbi:uncharacterized protein N0V89_000070 [Didymosphaeria variabile]|uniref:Uncharacterized protein n=1 Tax=Didymosphaeria variabile TaxID=1932322 RepID=A0A9W8XVF1_9PLEO|nr:uncharacterized protein N0V89_000070 [Didymosphaeria variabile]KAJ4359515.1 hypothetical protein N0V89_000070 [Didymosphaeria variabile]
MVPAVSTVAATGSVQSSGDVIIRLSDGLAQRLTEMVTRNHQCPAGDSFSGNNERLRQRLDTDWPAAICGSEQILLNVAPELAFGDVLLLRLQPLLWTAQEAVRAMGVVMQFARDLAENMGVTPEIAASIGVAVFALVTLNIVEEQPLAKENRISGDKLQGTMTPSASFASSTKTTSSSSSSSSSGLCTAACNMTGAIKNCETVCPGGRPTEIPESDRKVTTVHIEPWTPLPLSDWVPMIEPTSGCQQEAPKQYPEETFNETVDEFCAVVGMPWSNNSWVVDSAGKNTTSPASKRSLWQSARDLFVSRRDETSDQTTLELLWTPTDVLDLTCSLTCKESLSQLAFSNCSSKTGNTDGRMGAGGGIYIGCGSYSFSINQPKSKAKITCRNHELSAPQHDSESEGATSVESAITQWCDDNDGKKVIGTDSIYERYGTTDLGVSDQSSFWLRGSLSCGDTETVRKDDCKKSLLDGMAQCDPDGKATHGETASMGCLDYSLDLSGVTQDDNPPWNEKHQYPPPESAPSGKDDESANSVICDTRAQPGRALTEDQTNEAIAAYCKNEAAIPGFGDRWSNIFNYPPKGEAQFYSDDRFTMHLALGAETIDNKEGNEFYKDTAWCE